MSRLPLPRSATAVVGALAVALSLSACGSSEPTTQPTSPAGASSSVDAGPVTVTDARGQEVTLDQPAERVVGLEWGEVEMLVSLGVMPVGVADVEGYKTWVTAEPLDASVTDVGTRSEPSVDSIVALEPDLVVMEAERDSPLVRQIEEYVPVLVTKGSDATRNLDRMREDLTMIAEAVGRTAEAEKALADFDAALADATAAIEEAGATGDRFAMADGWKEGSTVSVRMFGTGSLVSGAAEAVGLQNAWPARGDKAWGLAVTDVEGLKKLGNDDVHFFYSASDGQDVFAGDLAGNPIWDSLPFVKQGSTTKLTDGTWTFGGPKSCLQFVDQLVQAFTG